jgi:transposase-like protein
MYCPDCSSIHIHKNGKRGGKQRYRCAKCDRQFLGEYQTNQGYSDEVKRECLEMYVNGMGLRAIERVKRVHHTTIGLWVKLVGQVLPDAPPEGTIPEVTEFDELETFVGAKKTKSGFGRS